MAHANVDTSAKTYFFENLSLNFDFLIISAKIECVFTNYTTTTDHTNYDNSNHTNNSNDSSKSLPLHVQSNTNNIEAN